MEHPEPSGQAQPATTTPATTTLDERRAFVRLASDLLSESRPVGDSHDVSWPGKVRDISRGGVGLVMQHRFRPGTRLDIELRDPTGQSRRANRDRRRHQHECSGTGR